MSSRRPPQRRRGAAHADPEAGSGGTADALLHPDKLEEHLSTVLGAAQAQIPDTTSDDDDAGVKVSHEGAAALNALVADAAAHTKALADALAIFAQGGDAKVQEVLKSEIAVTKKMESELAQIKKKVEAARRLQETNSAEYTKNLAQKDALHDTCKALITERERLEKYHAEQADADEVRRADVKAKFERDVESILAKVTDQSAQKQQTVEENATLTKEFETLKAEFDAMMEDKMKEWKERESATKELVNTLSEQIAEHEALQAECQLHETEARDIVEGIIAYSDQVSAYASRLGEFEAALGKSTEVVQRTTQQKQQLEDRINQLVERKAADVTIKRQLDDDCNKAKGRIRELRKHIQQLEKTKDSVEKKCRQRQEEFRRAAAGAAPAQP